MANKNDDYITAGELASYYGIPKQTLLYYDQKKLLVPAFVNEHGYRYYSVSQFLTLEIIINMRKLNIPIRDIRDYLQNRSQENFERILREKEAAYNKIIEEALEIKNSLQLSFKTMEKINKTHINQIQLKFSQEEILFVSEILTQKTSFRDHIKILSLHNQSVFSKKQFQNLTTGWIIDKNEFLAGKFNKTIRYFTPVSHIFSKKNCFIRPEGLYLTIRFQGTYYHHISEISQKIIDFIQRNYLQIISNIYVFPLKNHWLTEDTENYINQISCQVKTSPTPED